MAQFLSSHHCDDLCRLIGLTPFVLSGKRRRDLNTGHAEHVRHVEELGLAGAGAVAEEAVGEGAGAEAGEGEGAGADVAGRGGGGGGRGGSVVSSTGATGTSDPTDPSQQSTSQSSTPAATAFKARDRLLLEPTNSNSSSKFSNPLLAGGSLRTSTGSTLNLLLPIENKHSIDVESPPPPPRIRMSILPEGKASR